MAFLSFYKAKGMNSIVERLQSFIESEGKSCSFNPKLITPKYVYRIWGVKRDNQGGSVKLKEV